jgi:hypothetical protein
VYEFITKLHWQQAEVTKNQENNYVGNNGQWGVQRMKYRGLSLAAIRHMTVQAPKLSLQQKLG